MITSSLRSSARRFFHPKHHTWIRVLPESSDPTTIGIELGLSRHGWEEIGNVVDFRSMVKEMGHISAGQSLLEVEWEGHSITSADELYHAVWDSFQETFVVPAPVPGILVQTQDTSKVFEDEDTVLGILQVDPNDLKNAQKSYLVEESDYVKLLQSIPPGRFAEPSG